MVQSWPPPSREEEKSSVLPSGEKTGSVSLFMPLVSWRAWLPSARTVQSSDHVVPASRS
jgi:hypothetical protein